MINKIYKKIKKDALLSFEEIADGLAEEMCLLFERVLPNNGLSLGKKLLSNNTEIHINACADKNIKNIELSGAGLIGEVTNIKIEDGDDGGLFGIFLLVATIKDTKLLYSNNYIDSAWKSLINLSNRMNELEIKFNEIDSKEKICITKNISEIISAAGIELNKEEIANKLLSERQRNLAASKNKYAREWAQNEYKKAKSADPKLKKSTFVWKHLKFIQEGFNNESKKKPPTPKAPVSYSTVLAWLRNL